MFSSPDPDGTSSDIDINIEQTTALESACGEDPGLICEWVFDISDGNETLAQLARWFVDKPLMVLVFSAIAWVIARLARRATERLVVQVVNRSGSVSQSLERFGIDDAPFLLDDEEAAAKQARSDARARSISAVLGSTISVLVWTVAVLIIVAELGVQLGPLVASAGIAGVALGFGAQDLVKDCINGLFILLEDQYGLGDVVDVGAATGVVEEIALRSTVLRSLDGTVWHVPNGEIVRVGNMSQLWSMALVDVDVAYDADLEQVEQVIVATSDAVCAEEDWAEHIVEDPTLLGVERLGADGVTIRLVVKCSPGMQWALQRRLRQRIKVALDEAGIEIPFPQRTVWLRSDAESEA